MTTELIIGPIMLLLGVVIVAILAHLRRSTI